MVNAALLIAFLLPAVPGSAGFAAQVRERSMSSAHVTVYCPLNVDTSVANGYLWELENLYSAYSSRLELGRGGRLRVRLCDDKYDFMQQTGADSMLSPVWRDGTLYLIALDDIDAPGYRTKLATGVIRGVLDGIHQNGAPAWLVYATAVYETGEYNGLTPPPEMTVRYFSDLEEKIQSVNSGTDQSDLLFYLGYTGQFLDMKFGVGSLSRLLHEFDRPTGFEEAVREAFHISVPELQHDWRDYLSGLYNR